MRIAMTVPRWFMGGALWHQRAASDKSGNRAAGDRYDSAMELTTMSKSPDQTQHRHCEPYHKPKSNNCQRDLHPEPKVAKRGLNAIAPRIRQKPASGFNRRGRRPLPPRE
jgi:hypothetical protein